MTQPRTVQGEITQLADAETVGEAYAYALDLEDALWLSEGDKARVKGFVQRAVKAIKQSHKPTCGWLDFRCRRENRND